MEFVNKTGIKINVPKQTTETPTPLITVRPDTNISITDDSLIEIYKESGLTPVEKAREKEEKAEKKPGKKKNLTK